MSRTLMTSAFYFPERENAASQEGEPSIQTAQHLFTVITSSVDLDRLLIEELLLDVPSSLGFFASE